MSKGDHWVTQRPDGSWQDRKVGADRASSVHQRQGDAWETAQSRARHEKVEAFLTGRDHKIRERNTYGHDPRHITG